MLEECKHVALKKRRGSSRLENLGIPEEELLRQQQELFAQVPSVVVRCKPYCYVLHRVRNHDTAVHTPKASSMFCHQLLSTGHDITKSQVSLLASLRCSLHQHSE